MTVSFGAPFALPFLLAIPFLVWLARGRPRGVSSRQRWLALLLRAVLFAALVLAISDPRLGRPDERLSVVFAVDTSASVQQPQRVLFENWIRQATAHVRPGDQVSLVEFGRWAAPASPADGARPPVDATNLADALDLGASLVPPEGWRRIVLLSDGQQNVGRAQESAARLASRGIEVFFVKPEPPALLPEVLVRALEAPAYVREGETLQLDALIESTHATNAKLKLSIDGAQIAEDQVSLQPGTQRLSLVSRPQGLGFHVFRVEIEAPEDSLVANNSGEAFTTVREAGRVLVLENRAGEASALDETLRASGLRSEVRPTSVIPPSAAPLQVYESVVLVNVPATALSLDQQTTLLSYVQDYGRGLLVIGGNTSFSLGAYADTPLGEMIPVDPTPPARRERGNVAVILVIDKSGSMELYRQDNSKMAMAREAAMLAVEALSPDDQVGVIAFDTRFQWIVPLTRLSGPEDTRAVKQRIAALRADGGTSIFPALEAAYQAATSAPARLKHIVLLTDGQSADADYAALINRMRPFNITLTTVGVGSDTDTALLTKLALLGDGRYYFTERAQEVPKIMTRETTIVSRRALIEGEIHPRLTNPSPLLADLHGQTPPPLSGYVATGARPRAQTVMTSDRGDPLLATWQYGLGRVVAWTADARPDWSGAWLDSPAARRIWSQAVRWSMPPPTDPTFQLGTRVQGDEVALEVQAVERDGRFSDGRAIRATVTTPRGQAFQIPLRQVGPGRYEVLAQAPEPGTYGLLVEEIRNGSVARSETSSFVVTAGPELRTVAPNRSLLEQLAQMTGGSELNRPEDAFRRGSSTRATIWTPIWPWLLVVAVLLLPLDVAARRLSLFRR